MADRRAPFIVLAHHRSGSNLLTDLLQSHPCIECLNEPLSMHTAYFRAHDLEPWGSCDYHPDRLHAALPADGALAGFLRSLRDYLESSSAQRVIGLKETVLFGKLDWLRAYMPTLKIIFLQRDPWAIVQSVLRSGLMGLWHYERHVPAQFHALFPQHDAAPARQASVRSAELAAMSVVTRYELARRSLRGVDHVALWLDDLVAQPEPVLQRLADHLGVPRDHRPLAFMAHRRSATRGDAFSSFRAARAAAELSAAQRAAVERVLRVANSGALLEERQPCHLP